MKNSLLYTIYLCMVVLQGGASTCRAAQVHSVKIAPKVTLEYPAGRVTYFQPFRGTVSDSGGSGVAKVIVRITRVDERKRRWQWAYSWWLGRPAIDFRKDYWWVEAEIKGAHWTYRYMPSRFVQSGGHGAPSSGPDLHSGLYRIKVIAYDRANNSRALLRRVRVNADVSAPHIVIDSPRPEQKTHNFPTINGRVYERGGSGVESVKVTIYTFFPGKYTKMKRVWIGDQWSELMAAQPLDDVLTAQVKGNRWWLSRTPTSKGMLPGRYEIIVHAYDHAGNRNGLKGLLEERVSSEDDKILVEESFGSRDTIQPIYITIQ